MSTDPTCKVWYNSNQIPLYYRCFPGKRSDCYYSIIHGFAEHSGRYTRLIQCLQATGRTVLSYDLRGHGRSGGVRGYLRKWAQHWDDFQQLTEHLKKAGELPPCRTIILGHSMGGLIALEGTVRCGQGIGGLILSSPCLGLPLSAPVKFLNGMIAAIFPMFEYSSPVKPENLSRDATVCQAYKHDPLILKSIRAGTVQELLRAGDVLEKNSIQIHVPIWLLAAGNEHVVDLSSTLKIYAKLEAPFKKLRVFEEFRHEIFNEVQNEIAYDTVLQAIEQIVEFNSKSSYKQS